MRLLCSDALGRLILTDFRGKPIPPYAILSHRWSDSETLIEDILNGTYEKREEGQKKVQFCARRAAQDGLHYFWIDTCCIDRWDNNERSKAINSMFQWYSNATRCYVFLSDVSLSAVTETDTVLGNDWEASFRASTWFTRGWTLQELIAPVSVEFFSREGQRLGDKASLDQLLHSITGIPLAALCNCPLDQFSTSERMRWVGNRKTTEEEDIVYCLLGLLGISMPVTYGEGQEIARRRLQTEIETTGSAPSIIPFSRNESFVGREPQLAELEAKLFGDDQTTTMLAIVGPGGTGKSQLALEVAHRTRLNNKSCSVFWMDASDKDSLYRSYTSVAQKLSIPGYDDDQADIKQIVKRCVAEVSRRQCLLIFDNAEGTTVRPTGRGSSTREAPDLANFLPHSKLCSVIFTTTESNIVEALVPRNVTALHELTPDTALRMLQSRLTTPLSNAGQQEAMHLLRELSYLPLAVAQAAACMNASSMTVQQYQEQLDQYKKAALECIDDFFEGEQGETSLSNTVSATLSLSISQVRQCNAVAADYLFVAACVNRKDISVDLLEAASLRAREDAIKALARYALITRRPAESSFDVHRLVHHALQKRLQMLGQLQEWTQRTTTQLLRAFPDHDHGNRSKWRRLLPHAQYALSHSRKDDDDDEKLDLARKCAITLCVDGQYNGAEELQVQVMQTSKRVLGDEHLDTLNSMSNLALMYESQGRWKEAEGLNVQVMGTRKRVLGDEHPDTLTSISNLASTYIRQGRWKEAEGLQVQELQARKRVLGDEHLDTLTSMNNLASTYISQGRWKEAEELQVQELQTRKRVLGDEHHDTLSSISNLALTYTSQGRWKEAEELNVQVMQTSKRVLGDEHPSTLTSMSNLALMYESQGRWKEAEELQVQELQTSERVLGDEHPDTLTSMNNLALTYTSQGRWKEAEELNVQVMGTRKRLLGDEHPSTLTSISNLASTYMYQGRWKDAEKLNVQVMRTRKRVLGDEHPSTLTSMHNLAYTLQSQSRHKEALALMETCCQSLQQVLGEQHPDTQSSLETLNGWRADLREGQWWCKGPWLCF